MCLHLHTKACKVGALPIEKSDLFTSTCCVLMCSLSLGKKSRRIMNIVYIFYCRKMQSLDRPQQQGRVVSCHN